LFFKTGIDLSVSNLLKSQTPSLEPAKGSTFDVGEQKIKTQIVTLPCSEYVFSEEL
jgi:hypothetical protein